MREERSRISRRRILRTLGAGSITGIAGCSAGGAPPASRTTTGVDTATDAGSAGTPAVTPSGGRCPPVEYVLDTGYDQDDATSLAPGDRDTDWEVTSDGKNGPGSVPRDAHVVRKHPAWSDPLADSRWISIEPDKGRYLSPGQDRLFEYAYCFCLNDGFRDPKIEIALVADDRIDDIKLNGMSLPFAGTGSFGDRPIEETYTDRRLFTAGENCLTVAVEDTAQVVTGLNLVGTVTAENADCDCDTGACDLAVEKHHEGTFEFGGTGTYVIDVCNVGDGPCDQAAVIHDTLPDGVSFRAASGPGWTIVRSGGTLKFTHPNADGLGPGECLPPVTIEVAVAPFEEFPTVDALENCAELRSIGPGPTYNDRDCDTACVGGEHCFRGGERDDFDTTNDEPAVPSGGLSAHLDDRFRDFDEAGVNKAFGHTFANLRPSPVVGEICDARLEICLRPEGSSLDVNDRIDIGVWDAGGNAIDTHWNRYLGSYGGTPGVFDGTWHAPPGSTGETQCLTLDLAALPEEDGSATNLLSILNTHDRLSVTVQDDTAVDFARLCVSYCCDGTPGGECDLAIDKTVGGPFRFGESGTYVVDVCNEGETVCDGPVEVRDDLPAGLSFDVASGQGWRCTARDGALVCRHRNAGGLAPGECLPPLTIEVEVVPEEEWPGDLNAVRNCAGLHHGGQLVMETCIEHDIGSGGGAGDCQLSVNKTVERPFEFGGTGAYGFEVCNEGDETCEREVVQVTDTLPEGFRFVRGGGARWDCEAVDGARREVVCTYEGVTLGPGECLPRAVLEIEVVSRDEWPHDATTVRNCAELTATGRRLDEDCIEHEVGSSRDD